MLLSSARAAEPIFPPELRKRQPAELALPGERCAWYRPLSLGRLLDLKQQYPHAKLVVGNTGGQVGMHVYCKMSYAIQPRRLGLHRV
jgi:xanthine dehydrogenase/oxidase